MRTIEEHNPVYPQGNPIFKKLSWNTFIKMMLERQITLKKAKKIIPPLEEEL